MAKRKAAKRKRKTAGPTWSRYIADVHGDPQGLCSDGKAAATFVAVMEKRGASVEEIWEAAPEGWKEKVVEACQDSDGGRNQDLIDALDNAVSYGGDSLTVKEAAALQAMCDRQEAIQDPADAACTDSTPTLGVVDGSVRVVSWA